MTAGEVRMERLDDACILSAGIGRIRVSATEVDGTVHILVKREVQDLCQRRPSIIGHSRTCRARCSTPRTGRCIPRLSPRSRCLVPTWCEAGGNPRRDPTRRELVESAGEDPAPLVSCRRPGIPHLYPFPSVSPSSLILTNDTGDVAPLSSCGESYIGGFICGKVPYQEEVARKSPE